jgi:hypothetical protein
VVPLRVVRQHFVRLGLALEQQDVDDLRVVRFHAPEVVCQLPPQRRVRGDLPQLVVLHDPRDLTRQLRRAGRRRREKRWAQP